MPTADQNDEPRTGQKPTAYGPADGPAGRFTTSEGDTSNLEWHPPDRNARVPHAQMFRRVRPGLLVAADEGEWSEGGVDRAWNAIRHLLFGHPIPTTHSPPTRPVCAGSNR